MTDDMQAKHSRLRSAGKKGRRDFLCDVEELEPFPPAAPAGKRGRRPVDVNTRRLRFMNRPSTGMGQISRGEE
ncbi:hypothetical protein H920_19677 [Fukomys damarensis]|uniref:Uncharacterized protein n=1 Tax=Fukomys damarensis TaxID=885580 RepID=A0A091CN71_FUKDA|nr:hypothetical protein H920_19677 [Fukomys damarensis]